MKTNGIMTTEQTPKCPYRLRWEGLNSMSRPKVKAHDGKTRRLRREHCQDAGYWMAENQDGTWRVYGSFAGAPNFVTKATGEKGQAEARKRAAAHDWAQITRNHLTKAEKGVWEAAGGRIRVVKMTSPELTKALPLGHVSTSPGYGIFVDGRFVESAFTVRKAQIEIGIVPTSENRHQQARIRRYDMTGEAA